jgi:hypothetical protein
MNRINYDDLSVNIARILSSELYRFDHPVTADMTATQYAQRDQRGIEAFYNDPLFRAKVERITSVVVDIVRHHEDISFYGTRRVEERDAKRLLDVLLIENFGPSPAIQMPTLKQLNDSLTNLFVRGDTAKEVSNDVDR